MESPAPAAATPRVSGRIVHEWPQIHAHRRRKRRNPHNSRIYTKHRRFLLRHSAPSFPKHRTSPSPTCCAPSSVPEEILSTLEIFPPPRSAPSTPDAVSGRDTQTCLRHLATENPAPDLP